MSFLDQVSVLILAYNEAPNIVRTLEALKDFREVVVLDSGSTDETLSLASRYPNVRVASRPFDSHSAQWNHALTGCGLTREWILALDADYVLSRALVDELAKLEPSENQSGYRASFRYLVFGRPLSAALYPPVIALYRRRLAHYVQEGHTQRVVIAGQVASLRHRIDHDDRKPLGRWLVSQGKYAVLEAKLLLDTPWAGLRLQDKIRRLIVIAPWLVPVYCLVIKRGLLDGWAGVFYALQRGVAEGILSIQLVEIRLRNKD